MAGVKSQAPYFHRVRSRIARTPTLPVSRWTGHTFIEPDGTQLEVVWNGHVDGPTLCGPIERTSDTDHLPARINLPRVR